MSDKSREEERAERREWAKQKALEEIVEFSQTIKELVIIIPKKEDCEPIFVFSFEFDEKKKITIKSKELKDPKNFAFKYLTLFSNTVPETLHSFKNFHLLLHQLSNDVKIKQVVESNFDEVDYVAMEFCDFLLRLEITRVREDFVLNRHHALDFKDKKQVYIKTEDVKNFIDNSNSKIGRDLLTNILGKVKIKDARLSIGGRANKINVRVWLVDLDEAEKFSKSNMEFEELSEVPEVKEVLEDD